MRISDWSSDVCSSDLAPVAAAYTGDKLIRPASDPESMNTRFLAIETGYDIILEGAGTGGWADDVHADRMGNKVLLSDETAWIGGQMAEEAETSMEEDGPQVSERGISGRTSEVPGRRA